MWIITAIMSAILLGFYDAAKKQALRKNDVFQVLLSSSVISVIFFLPVLISSAFSLDWFSGTLLHAAHGTLRDHMALVIKAVVVSASWILGYLGIKHLPITIASTLKASRPVFVILFSIILFGERLSLLQWGGVLLSLTALYLLSVSSRQEGIDFYHNKWILCMVGSVVTGVASALWDKHIVKDLSPIFIQGWCNFYIMLCMGAALLAVKAVQKEAYMKFRYDRTVLLVAVLITFSDFLYFYCLSCEGAMLSIVSMLRRASVIVTFICGAALFKERNLRAKGLELALLLVGITLLAVASL